MRGRALGPGSLKKRGERWTLCWTDEHGKRRRRTLSGDKRTAEKIRADLITQRDLAIAGLGNHAGQGRTLGELRDAYLADLEPRCSPMHLKNVAGRLRRVLAGLEDRRVRDFHVADAVALRSRSTAAGASPRTANLITDTLRAMFTWAVDAGLVATSPLRGLKRLPDGEGHTTRNRRALSEEEIQRFLAASERDDAENEVRAALEGLERVPQTPLWLALIETGARWGEIRQLAWGDVDFDARVVVLRAETTKARRQRVLPVREGLLERLRALRERGGDRVFLSPEGCPWKRPTTNPMRVLRRVLAAAGIARVDAQGRTLDLHALRHTAATRLARSGAPLIHAQRILGHADPKLTSRVYAHLDAEDLRAAVEGVPDPMERVARKG